MNKSWRIFGADCQELLLQALGSNGSLRAHFTVYGDYSGPANFDLEGMERDALGVSGSREEQLWILDLYLEEALDGKGGEYEFPDGTYTARFSAKYGCGFLVWGDYRDEELRSKITDKELHDLIRDQLRKLEN